MFHEAKARGRGTWQCMLMPETLSDRFLLVREFKVLHREPYALHSVQFHGMHFHYFTETAECLVYYFSYYLIARWRVMWICATNYNVDFNYSYNFIIHHIRCWNSYDSDTNDYNTIIYFASFYWCDIPCELLMPETSDANVISR